MSVAGADVTGLEAPAFKTTTGVLPIIEGADVSARADALRRVLNFFGSYLLAPYPCTLRHSADPSLRSAVFDNLQHGAVATRGVNDGTGCFLN